MSFHQSFAEWSQWVWPLFINHLWQATLFAMLVWGAVVVLLKRAPARAQHHAWLLAFLKFTVPATWLVWGIERLGVVRSTGNLLTAESADAQLVFWQIVEPMAINSTVTAHREIYCLLTLVWLVGAAALLMRWGLRRKRFARVVRTHEMATTGRPAELFAEAQTRASVQGRITLITSAQVTEPGVWGVWRPVVILPVGLAEQLTDEEFAAVLLHELFHVRHYDNLRSSLQMLLCCTLWFHPLVWLLDRRLLAARELICDENVLRCGNAAETYAAGLWKVVQHGLGWPLAGVSRATGADLKRRIKLMLNTETRTRETLMRRLVIGTTIFALLGIAVATAWMSRGNVQAAKVSVSQDPQTAASFDLPVENAAESPPVITRARMSLGHPVPANTKGKTPDGQIVEGTNKGENIRRVSLEAQLQNLDSRHISKIAVEVRNPSLGEEITLTILAPVKKGENVQGGSGIFERDGVFDLSVSWPMKDHNEILSHLIEFRLTLVGVQYEGEKTMVWLRREAEKQAKKVMFFDSSRGKTVTLIRSNNPASAATYKEDSIVPMATDLRPTILYRERAQYTKEAREQKVEGTIVLSVVFGADGRIGNIQAVKGLPHGLTDAAIKAAEAIRFSPALKDGQAVNVQGNLEFSFRLQESGESTKQ